MLKKIESRWLIAAFDLRFAVLDIATFVTGGGGKGNPMDKTPSPVHVAETLTALVDVLIPGDDDFPSASHVGTQGLLARRIQQRLGNDAFARIVGALDRRVSFAGSSVQEKVASVEELTIAEPELFAFLRFATYYSYYEMPAVIAALQVLGHDYNDAPQPLGYELPPFDPEVNLPANPRGSYKQTNEIIAVDLSGLAHLRLPVTGV